MRAAGRRLSLLLLLLLGGVALLLGGGSAGWARLPSSSDVAPGTRSALGGRQRGLPGSARLRTAAPQPAPSRLGKVRREASSHGQVGDPEEGEKSPSEGWEKPGGWHMPGGDLDGPRAPVSPLPPVSRRPRGSSSHSLHYFETAIWEPGWRLPQFTSLAYVDDQLIGRYDTDTDQCVPQSSWIEKISHDDSDFWARSTNWDFTSSLVMDLMILKNLYNQSRGIHTLQALSGCELSEDNHTTRGFAKYGYNGRDFLSLDMDTLTWTVMDAKAKPIKKKWEAEQNQGKFWEHFLTDTCVEWLHTHLHYGKETLLKADPPMVRVTRQAGSDGWEILICRAHGFYPKEADITWRKDGEVWHQDTLHGGVVPNSDGTYHTWLSINVDSKERDRFRCHVEHDALQEPLDLAWEVPDSKVGLIVGVLLGVVAAVILVGAGVIVHSKKQEDSYNAAPTSDQRSDSSVSVGYPFQDRGANRGPLEHPFSIPHASQRKDVALIVSNTDISTEPPKVKLIRKVGYDDLETLICRLDGFYPKEIDVTWWKNEEDRKPDTITGGVVPNSDGTYHTWLSIKVEPKERECYRCHVEHDGLLEPLDLAWKEPVPSSVSNLGLTDVRVAVATILLGAEIIF
uniref:class I histocompatibility antigen, F10 alpha chain-like n=1 Tax=Euleptes europaea TaxID=460621 RepID=UPI00253F66F5|nr:class I histocompatibility antigen, F10 alpha chain-like [Euleptes europaea]